MLNGITVLVTGASGLLGTNTILELLTYWYQVVGLVRSKSRFKGWEHQNLKLIEGELPEDPEIIFEGRTILFEGVLNETGTFKFKVFLDVVPYYPEPTVCREYNTSKSCEMIIDLN
ncbi:NAD-dependent epimerase/dehydratase family protein [Aestuariibaculum suncheonense]|uniref:NAD-dependent epimerase/dehydratase family protein n=1 Tax=Aestuariibaculum suncheonense TaxID=1028745 RepID=A0A8J6ULG2_9FLAO|nr:NAD-dependent epimerase/dehydratase family protein [Aestuariibaculum suncheonense]MBD0836356.1 NAD-dependent epimerase/dehydratase family protein [Aestuariibaculum suncheonense]